MAIDFNHLPVEWYARKNMSHFKLHAAFTLHGFEYKERSLMLVKTAFQVLKFKYLTYSSILFTNKTLRECINKKYFYTSFFVWYLVVKPACGNAALDTKTNSCSFSGTIETWSCFPTDFSWSWYHWKN